MGRIIDLTVPENINELLKRNQTTTDFRILTDGMVSDLDNTNIVRMIGSSTERDLEGDTMSMNALHSMTKAAPNMTVWLNHDYTLPGSMFGSVIETPKIVHSNGIADLHLAVDVELENPAAAQVKRYIDKGRRLGCSIGCMVTQFEVADDNDDMSDEQIMKIMQVGNAPIIIHGVYVVEYSVVGIPANQRSWVENAIRGVFTRTLHPSLAPAMKTLWPRQFQEVLETRDIASDTKEYFKSLPARGSSGRRLDYLPEKKMFLFSSAGTERYMNREEVQEYMAKAVSDVLAVTPVVAPYKEQVKEPELIQTACGSTSLALDMESSWDKGSAHGRILAWAGGKDNFSKSKMKQVHFRYDGDGSNITDYHLPFADIKNGHPVAIWHAIIAVASSLGGGRSGLTHEGDEGAIRSKVAHYYHKAGKTPPWQDQGDSKSMGDENIHTHEHDEITHTHAEDTTVKHSGFAINKGGAPGVLIDANGNHEAVTGTHTHFHRMPQDAEAKTASALGVIHNPLEVQEPTLSGKVPMDTGDGGEKFDNPLEVTDPVSKIKLPVNGQIHIHEHTHSGDNNHEHVHEQDTVQAFKPPVSIQNADRDGDNDIDMDGVGDSGALNAGGGRQLEADPDVTKAQLELYNNLGKMLGFEEKAAPLYPAPPAYDTPPAPVGGMGVPPHVQKRAAAIHARIYALTGGRACMGVGSDGSHLTQHGVGFDGNPVIPVHKDHAYHIQAIHDHAHALSGAPNDGDADDMQKQLEMHVTKAPGDGVYGPGSGGGNAPMPDHVHNRIHAMHMACYSMTGGKVCKGIGSDGQHLTYPGQAPDGSHPVPHHPAHAGHIQAVHDHTSALTNGMTCRSLGANETNYTQARQQLMDAEGQTGPDAMHNPLKSFDGMPESLDRVVKALEGINTKGMADEVVAMKKELQIARKGIAAVYEEAAKAAATVAALKNMPLGNPVRQSRTVETDPTITTHDELKTLAAGPDISTVSGLLALTQLETVKMPNGMSISYRKWTNGLGGAVGKGLRPALTSNQIALMPFEHIEAYRAGFAADVPMVDDPGQSIDLF